MESKIEKSDKEVERFVKIKLKEAGAYPELLRIKVEDGVKVVLRGEVESWEKKYTVHQIVAAVLDSYDVVDELDVFEEARGNSQDEDEDEMFDEDHERIGTGDVFRSVEEGLPYIPPTGPSYRIFSKKGKGRAGR
ncbi:MAG: hypothetical protein ABH844_06980 [Candidatus Omnitrophota bacterium]